MSTSRAPPPPPATAAVPLRFVERDLNLRMKELQGDGEAPVLRARMSNLVIYCNSVELAERVTAVVPSVVAVHPARVLMLIGEPGPETKPLTASITVRPQLGSGRQLAFSEQVTLHAGGSAIDRLPFAVRTLLIGDLPTNLWWAAPQPPPLAGPLLFDLADRAQQIIYDSIGWPDPARGVVATADWLVKIAQQTRADRWQVASDLNWRRLKYWRRLLAQALDPGSAPGALESITEVHIEHGPHAVIQAWEVVSWLARRLDWQVLTGRVQPGVSIAWRFMAPHGDLRVRINRLEQGPPEIKRMHIACSIDGKPGALHLVAEENQRMAVVVEGIDAAPRTVSVPRQSAAELVGRQLSDREPDSLFRESMTVAQSLARSVLG